MDRPRLLKELSTFVIWLSLITGIFLSFNQTQVSPANAMASELAGSKKFLPMMMLRFTPGYGVLEGVVLDASSDNTISDAEVCVGDICVRSDEDGHYRFEALWAGSMVIHADHADYFPRRQGVTILPGETTQMDIALADRLLGHNAQLRIMVTWDGTKVWQPSGISNDLDSHLWVSNLTQGIQHIYADPSPNEEPYTNGDCTVYPNVCQVNDDVDGYGPETTDFRVLETNTTYYFGVLNVNQYEIYPDVPPMSKTKARVEVYNQNGLIKQFSVPTQGVGDFWYVFSMDSAGNITPAQGSQGCIIWYPGDALPSCP